jgi:hypothetical protein
MGLAEHLLSSKDGQNTYSAVRTKKIPYSAVRTDRSPTQQ